MRRHPLPSYFVLAFAISWAGILAIILSGLTGPVATEEEFTRLMPVWVPLLTFGPTIAGILVTALVAGRPGLRELRARLVRWRIGGRWYAAALLTAPLYFTAVSLACAAFSPEFLPAIVTADDPAGLLVRGLVVGLTAGIFEELGWTGVAVPWLRRRHGVMATGLIVGVLWGLWHFLPKIWGAGAFGQVPYLPAELLSAVVGLTGFRVLMVWVYDRTESLLLAMLMHASLTVSAQLFQPVLSGATSVALGLGLAVVPWLLVAMLVILRRTSRAPLVTASARSS